MHFLQRQQKKIYIIWHTQKKTIENKRYKTKTQQNEDTTWIELLLFIQVFLGNEIVDTILMKLFEVFRLLFCCLFVGLENVCICRNAWNCFFYSYVNDQIWILNDFSCILLPPLYAILQRSTRKSHVNCNLLGLFGVQPKITWRSREDRTLCQLKECLSSLKS